MELLARSGGSKPHCFSQCKACWSLVDVDIHRGNLKKSVFFFQYWVGETQSLLRRYTSDPLKL